MLLGQLEDTLPSGWLWKQFGELVAHSQNGISKRRSAIGNPIPVLRLADIREGMINESAPRDIKLSDEEVNKYVLRDGDLLCIRVNGSRSLTGRLVYFRTPKVWTYCDHFIRFRLKPEISDSKYIAYYFQTQAVRAHLSKHMVSTAGQNTVSQGTMLGVTVPVPPMYQQQAIVAEIEKQFSRLDEAVANLKRVKANLKRYKAAVLKAAVKGKLTEGWRKQHPNVDPASKLLERTLAERRGKWGGKGKYKVPPTADTRNLPALPDSWVWCITDALFSYVTSGSRGWAQHYSVEGPLFIRIGNLDHDSIQLDLEDIQRVKPPEGAEGTRTKVEEGDILVSITADVGMIAVAPPSLGEAYINQHVALARPVLGICREYLAWYLASRDGGQKHFRRLQRGATKVGLGLDNIRAVPVPLPPLAEQQQIVAEVERRLSVLEELEAAVQANLTRADRLRRSILHQAFKGELLQ